MKQALSIDVVIVGAGIVGSALACALAKDDIQIAIVEAQPLSTDWPPMADAIDGYDARVSALTVTSQQFLNDLDAWPTMLEQRVSPYTHMHVWDAEGTGHIDFCASAINQPVLGHIVENRVTATALLQRISTHRNIQCFSEVKLSSIEDNSEGYRVSLDDGREIQTPLLVAADGANSMIRTMADMATREWDYGHQAIVTTVATEHSHQNTAWQRFLPQGPLAFLPLSTQPSAEGAEITESTEHFSSIVWSATPEVADQIMALDDEGFKQRLAADFEHRLGAVTAVNRRFSFPLRQRHAIDYVKPGLALVGDAAHTIHPLAGQGVNLGLMDAQVLAQEISRAYRRELPLGDMSVLKRYQRRRQGHNLSMMAAMDGFKRLFEQPSLPVRWARNSGMRWLNNKPGLKHRLMRQAMGLQ